MAAIGSRPARSVPQERIATTKGLIASAALALRRDEWRDAARRTPHGKPIELNHG